MWETIMSDTTRRDCGPRLNIALFAVIVTTAMLAGCGGSSEPVATDAATAPAVAINVQPSGGGWVPPPGPTIAVQPQDATVGAGAGVTFSVSARAPAPAVITNYRWIKDGTSVVAQGLNASSYSITAADAATHGGVYTVEVSSSNGGGTTSAPARLSVIRGDWAPLGGRPLATGALAQQAALALCDGPTVAYLAPGGGGVAQVRVARFDGKAWVPVGHAALNVDPARAAMDPAMDCSEISGTPRPVVAWSEDTAPTGRTIQVKVWTGTQWVAVGNVGSAAGADARKPTLRLAPANDGWAKGSHLRTRSAIGWVENGFPRAKYWGGQSWQTYVLGFPGGSGVSTLALTLDLQSKAGGIEQYPPLTAHVQRRPAGGSAVSTSGNWAGWAQLGVAPSPAAPSTTPLSIAGIGYGTDPAGPGAVAVWTAGTQTYSIESSQLLGSDYVTALLQPLLPSQPNWAPYATAYTGRDLHAVAFDPRARISECSFGGRLSFALAVNDSNGTSVLRANCVRSTADPLVWQTMYRVHRRPAVSLSLRLASDTDPLFAAVEPVAGGHALSVWRYYP
jgi:hypothetical protein